MSCDESFKYDMMVVLGGRHYIERLIPAIKAYNEEKTGVIIFVDQDQGMRDDVISYLRGRGIPRIYTNSRIKEGFVVDDKDTSKNTFENFLTVRRIIEEYKLKGKKLCVVTDFHHVARAKTISTHILDEYEIDSKSVIVPKYVPKVNQKHFRSIDISKEFAIYSNVLFLDQEKIRTCYQTKTLLKYLKKFTKKKLQSAIWWLREPFQLLLNYYFLLSSREF